MNQVNYFLFQQQVVAHQTKFTSHVVLLNSQPVKTSKLNEKLILHFL